jgi:hypothetical protein
MRRVHPLFVALPILPGVPVGFWIGTGNGQGTAPRSAPPADAVQQADLKSWVDKRLPSLRDHLKMIENISAKVLAKK